MSGCRSEAGRLLQILGPATEKLLSPSRVFVLGTVRTLVWAEWNWGSPESVISWQSSTRYDGAWPCSEWDFNTKLGIFSVHIATFFGYLTKGHKTDPFELKMESATPTGQKMVLAMVCPLRHFKGRQTAAAAASTSLDHTAYNRDVQFLRVRKCRI